MTAAVTLLAKERNGPPIRCQVLLYPVTDAAMNTDSYREFADGPWLTAAAMAWFWDAYAPNRQDRTKPTASPLRANAGQLEGLPPALIIVDENDVLRTEGEECARKLMQSGVDVTAVRMLATFHDFALLNGLSQTPATKAAIAWASQKLSAALGIEHTAPRRERAAAV